MVAILLKFVHHIEYVFARPVIALPIVFPASVFPNIYPVLQANCQTENHRYRLVSICFLSPKPIPKWIKTASMDFNGPSFFQRIYVKS